MSTEKQVIYTNQDAINQELAQLDSNLRVLNAFLIRIKPQAGALSKKEYNTVVDRYDKVNFEVLNNIVFDRILASKPVLQSLAKEIDREDVKQFAKIDEFVHLYTHNAENPMAISGIVQASLLNENENYWSIVKGEAVLIGGIKDQIIEKYTYYAESEVELMRFKLCTDILKTMEELKDLSPDKDLFDMCQSVIINRQGKTMVDPDFVYRGRQAYDKPLYFDTSKQPEPMPLKPTISEQIKANKNAK